MSDDHEFKQLIISLLKRGNINDSHIEKFTSPENMEKYRLAFVHKSVDPENNYELLEFVGDAVIACCVVRYIKEQRFGEIKNVKYLTRLKHNIVSKKELALVAESAGFFKFIKISDEVYQLFKDMTPEQRHKDYKTYMSLLEDCFEAFIGATQEIIGGGVGVEIASNIIKSFLDEVEMSLDYDKVFDAKTRYKELCDRRGWKFLTCIKTVENKEPIPDTEDKFKRWYTVTIIGYPYGDQKKDEKNECELVKINRKLKVDAEHDACEIALRRLRKEFGIYDLPPDPYKRIN